MNTKGGTKVAWWNGADWTGKKFGAWLVLGYDSCGTTNGTKYHTKWLCRCDCGTERLVFKDALTKGFSRGCSACTGSRHIGNKNQNWKGNGIIPGTRWGRILNDAKTRDMEVSVDFTYVSSLYTGVCALTGLPLTPKEASPDRIDSSKGYIEGNIQWVHKDINKMKNNLDQDYFIEMCKKVTNYKDKQ